MLEQSKKEIRLLKPHLKRPAKAELEAELELNRILLELMENLSGKRGRQ